MEYFLFIFLVFLYFLRVPKYEGAGKEYVYCIGACNLRLFVVVEFYNLICAMSK